MRHIVFALALALGLSLAPQPASADIPPPDRCSTVGDACSTAPPDFKSPGVCTKSSCGRATPNGHITYECNRCEPKPKTEPKDKPKK